jgi:hypothetical protein
MSTCVLSVVHAVEVQSSTVHLISSFIIGLVCVTTVKLSYETIGISLSIGIRDFRTERT